MDLYLNFPHTSPWRRTWLSTGATLSLPCDEEKHHDSVATADAQMTGIF
jgi:hypothetical protein